MNDTQPKRKISLVKLFTVLAALACVVGGIIKIADGATLAGAGMIAAAYVALVVCFFHGLSQFRRQS